MLCQNNRKELDILKKKPKEGKFAKEKDKNLSDQSQNHDNPNLRYFLLKNELLGILHLLS